MEPSTKRANLHVIPEPISFLDDSQDFSLVLGGPLFQLLRKFRLEKTPTEWLHRRIVASIVITWLPLLVLSGIGSVMKGAPQLPFFRDIEVHARFLVALPVLIIAEAIVHLRMRPVVYRFVEWGIIVPEDMPGFRKATESAVKIRNSAIVEIALFVFVYTLGMWLWNSRSHIAIPTWYASPGGRWSLTAAGYWYVFVSIPIFQFILLRWYLRLCIWFRFLWQISRLNLNLLPIHPDRCGGLAFLGKSAYAFSPVLFAQGAVLAGVVADRVLYHGAPLMSFKFQILGFVAFFVVVVLGPLIMFTPHMARVRRQGLAEYGLLAQRYVKRFDTKWIRTTSSSEEMLGTGDIQSLADLGNSYDIIREMRILPFGLDDVSRLAIATAAPLSPLVFVILSPDEILMRVMKILF